MIIYFFMFVLLNYSPKNPENVSVSTEIWSSTTVFNIDNNQYIRMISEGSCDTEDWSNDAENSALNHGNKLYF